MPTNPSEELDKLLHNLTFGFTESEVRGMTFVNLNKYQIRDLKRVLQTAIATAVVTADRKSLETISNTLENTKEPKRAIETTLFYIWNKLKMYSQLTPPPVEHKAEEPK